MFSFFAWIIEALIFYVCSKLLPTLMGDKEMWDIIYQEKRTDWFLVKNC